MQSSQGTLDFKSVDKITFVGASSNTVIDTTTGSFGVGVDVGGPTSNLHVVGNAYVSTDLTVTGDINFFGTFNQNGAPFASSPWTTTGSDLSYTTGNVTITENLTVNTDTLFVDSVNDRVGVGTTTPGVTLDVVGTIRATTDVVVTSDRRLKSDIKRIEGALEKISKINGYMYTHNNQASSGCMAQEVKEVLPEVVRGSEDTVYTLAYGNMAGLIIEAIKELKSEMDELKSSRGII